MSEPFPYPELDRQMRDHIRQYPARDWRELPDAVRVEHVLAYLGDGDGFLDTVSASLEKVSNQRADRLFAWFSTFARGDGNRPSAEASVLVGSIYRLLENYISDTLEARWDRLRDAERLMDAEERGVYEQEGRENG